MEVSGDLKEAPGSAPREVTSGSTGSARTRRVAARENSPVNRVEPRVSIRETMCSAIGRCLSANSVVANAFGGSERAWSVPGWRCR